MNVIKRDGTEALFDKDKIFNAISKANEAVKAKDKPGLDVNIIHTITNYLADKYSEYGRSIPVEEIQDDVESDLIMMGNYHVAKEYIVYRYKRSLARHANTTDDKILSLINLTNEEIKQENSNKNPTIISTQRDYMAGEVSKDLTNRLLLPKDIVEAHNDGRIHFHDADYFAQPAYNCCLVNLEDMLQNGTVISGTKIEKPHSFSTACNVATQIVAQVASSQYGLTAVLK